MERVGASCLCGKGVRDVDTASYVFALAWRFDVAIVRGQEARERRGRTSCGCPINEVWRKCSPVIDDAAFGGVKCDGVGIVIVHAFEDVDFATIRPLAFSQHPERRLRSAG